MNNYEEDLRIIAAATPGPWYRDVWRDGSNTKGCMNVVQSEMEVTICDDIVSGDAAHIAHFDPAYTKHLVEKAQKCDALAEENEALTKRVVELEKVLQLCAGYLNMEDAHERHAFSEVRGLLK